MYICTCNYTCTEMQSNLVFSPKLITVTIKFFLTQIDKTKHNRLGMRHLRLIHLLLDADSCQRNVYNTVRAAINLIRQSMSPSNFFVSLHTAYKNPPTFLSKETQYTKHMSCPDGPARKLGHCCDLVQLAAERDKPSGKHGSVMSKMRAGNAFKVFLCIPLGVIWGHMVDIEESPLKSPINVCPSPHKVRIGQFTGLQLSCKMLQSGGVLWTHSCMQLIKSGIVLCRQITFFLSLCVISPFMEVKWSTLAVRIQKHLQQVVYQKQNLS